MVGRTIGQYRILERLGEGGMGEVYLAEDLKLKRKAAIKFIAADLVRDDARRQRFVQEATLAASVDHPHVAAIFDVDQADGQTYIAMEYVRGRPLRALLKDGALPPRRAIELAIQIADALARVHEAGVTHRDLKPENVIVSGDGYAKIIDFGIAKLVDQAHGAEDGTLLQVRTTEGELKGTVAYMSPEQARGAAVDARSDVFTFGVLLHELFTGQAPFRRSSTAETLSAILTESSPPIVNVDAAITPEIERIVRKATAKDLESRYQHMRDVVVDLRGLRERIAASHHATSTTASIPASAATPRRNVAAMVAAVLLVVAAIAAAVWYFRPRPAASPRADATASSRPVIAILNFEQLGGAADTAWLASGLSSMLVTGLAQSPEIQVVTRDRLDDAARQIGRDRFDVVDAGARAEVIRRAGATFVVNGTIVHTADELRIDARVEDVAGGRVILADNVRGKDPLSLADDLAARIRTRLNVRPQADVRRVSDLTTSSLDAYRVYTEASEAFSNVRTADAKRLFEQAIAIDADFAMAHLGLAGVHQVAGEMAEATRHLRDAAGHVDRLSEREALILRASIARHEGRFADALPLFETVIAKYPDAIEAHVGAFQIYETLGEPTKAVGVIEHATRSLASNGPLWNILGYAYLGDGRVDDAVRAFETYVRLRPGEPNALDSLAEGLLVQGNLAAAEDTARRAIQAGRAGSAVTLSWILATAGELEESVTAAPTPHVAAAVALARLGRRREAEAALGQLRLTAEKNADRDRLGLLPLIEAALALEYGDCGRARAAVVRAKAAADGDRRRAPLLIHPTAFSHLVIGTCDARSGDLTAARARLAEQQRVGPATAPTLLWWRGLLEGEIALAAGDASSAEALFRRAEPGRTLPFNRSGPVGMITVLAHSIILRDGVARALYAQRRIDDAIAEYRRLLKMERGATLVPIYEPRYHLAIARLLTKQGKPAEARVEYQRFLDYWQKADGGRPELAEARAAVR